MRSILARHVFAALAAASTFSLAAPAFAGNAWEEIRGTIYGTKKIEDGRGMITLTAPNRPEDMRVVPIGIAAHTNDGRAIKTVSYIIDENPTPVVAVFHMGPGRDTIALNVNFRVDRQSDVRAVVETEDGKLYMVSQLVKYAGGQSSCSAPPAGDPAEIAANMGKMNVTEIKMPGTSSSALIHAKVDLNHPNHTGMVMDQMTLLYTPMKMVSEVSVRQGGELLFTAEGSIGLSQNPVIEFDFKRGGADKIDVTMKDTDGGNWTKSFPVGPQS